jgi:hypothetical protein
VPFTHVSELAQGISALHAPVVGVGTHVGEPLDCGAQ